MSAREIIKFGLLFSRDRWNDNQIISEDYVEESLQLYWGKTPSMVEPLVTRGIAAVRRYQNIHTQRYTTPK